MAFEGILSQPDTKPRRFRRWMLGTSLALHGGAVIAGIVHSIWQVEELPMPQIQVSLVADVPPPPPPPPPPARKQSTKPKTKPVEKQPDTLTIPKENQKPTEPEPAEQEQEQAGVEGGVEGGVQGGVIGGVVGAAPPPPPPPKPEGPKILPPNIGRQLLLINPNVDPYRVKLPRALQDSGQTFTARLEICVTAQGAVYSVRILKAAGPAIDSQIPSVVRRWRYKPMQVDGRPTAFCYRPVYQIG